MELVIIMLIMAIVFIGLEKLLRKWLGIKKVTLSDTPAKNIDRWGNVLILFVLLSIFPFSDERGNVDRFLWFFSAALLSMSTFQVYLQWRYIKESKEYMVTLLLALIGLPTLLVIAFFL